MTRTTSGEWILAPSEGLRSEDLARGVEALDASLKGGPVDRISRALMAMVAVTRRPSSMDDDRAKLYFAVIQKAMLDYPVDVVEAALEEWRKGPSGEWWPAEAELRRVCERLFEPRKVLRNHAMRLLSNLEAEEERAARAQQPSPFAGDKHQAFREGMRARMTPTRYEAYFHPADTRYEGEDRILVRKPVTEAVLHKEGGDLIRSLGITVRHAPEVFMGLPQRTPQQTTPAEDREIARGLLAVARSLGIRGIELDQPEQNP